MEYKILSRDEIEKLQEIDRTETVRYNYRLQNGKLELFSFYCEIPPFTPKQLRNHLTFLYELFDHGGTVFGAFADQVTAQKTSTHHHLDQHKLGQPPTGPQQKDQQTGQEAGQHTGRQLRNPQTTSLASSPPPNHRRLVGIASLDNKFRGRNHDTLQLQLLHVSNGYRNMGVGSSLVELVKEKARELGAKRLYVSGAPIQNTIDFYLARGCSPTTEIEEDLFELEPEDIHMEMQL